MQNPLSGSVLSHLILVLILRAGRLAAIITRYQVWIHTIVGIVAFVLGFWGWSITAPPQNLSGIFDNLFRTAQLLTFQFPADFRGAVPIPLQIARLALPIVALLASFQVLVGSITRPARLALLPYLTDHIVVWGSETLTEAAVATLASRGRQIVVVLSRAEPSHREFLEGLGLTVVVADPLQDSAIQALHLSHAAAFLVASGDDVKNLNVAMRVLHAVRARPSSLRKLVLAVLLAREDLATELDAALDGLSRRHNTHYQRLCPARDGLRSEFKRFAPVFLKADPSSRSHILVVGINNDWRQVVAQLMIAAQDHPEKRPLLTFLVDEKESADIDHWRASNPDLDLVVEIALMKRRPDELLAQTQTVALWQNEHSSPQLVVILREDADAIGAALALRRPGSPFGTEPAPILVHQTVEDRLLSQLAEIEIGGRDMTRLVAIGGLIRAESIERVLDYKGDEFAIALHVNYLQKGQTQRTTSAAASVEWDDLPENLREANRVAADHAPILFRALGLCIVSESSKSAQVSLAKADLELLAQIEHRRWMADRIARGWRSGKWRDDIQRVHPSIAPYSELSESEREKDRETVSVLIAAMESQGLTLQAAAARDF